MARAAWGSGSRSDRGARMTFVAPTYAFLEARARKRVPQFAFDFVQGGTGDDLGLSVNRRLLDDMVIVPRYGELGTADACVTLFDRNYNMPIGIAPTGMDALIWPGATMALARAARAKNIPYIAGMLANSTIEEVAQSAGSDNTWLQLYSFPRDNHKVTLDIVERARRAGVRCIVLTMDAPVRAKRPRDLNNRLVVPFRPTPKTIWQVAKSTPWLWALLRHGAPRFANLDAYVDGRADLSKSAAFVQTELKGSFAWDEISLIRRHWDGPLLVKGILHWKDAVAAHNAGADGVVVSNHGGRQSDGAPSPMEVLSGICDRAGDKIQVYADSGVTSGLDAVRMLALGARCVFSGRGFLYGLAALGDNGGLQFANLIEEELKVAMAQSGAWSVSDFKDVEYYFRSASGNAGI